MSPSDGAFLLDIFLVVVIIITIGLLNGRHMSPISPAAPGVTDGTAAALVASAVHLGGMARAPVAVAAAGGGCGGGGGEGSSGSGGGGGSGGGSELANRPYFVFALPLQSGNARGLLGIYLFPPKCSYIFRFPLFLSPRIINPHFTSQENWRVFQNSEGERKRKK